MTLSQDDDVGAVQFTRQACPLNNKRAYTWQVMLACMSQCTSSPQFSFSTRHPAGFAHCFGFMSARRCGELSAVVSRISADDRHFRYTPLWHVTRAVAGLLCRRLSGGLPRNGTAGDHAPSDSSTPAASRERARANSHRMLPSKSRRPIG